MNVDGSGRAGLFGAGGLVGVVAVARPAWERVVPVAVQLVVPTVVRRSSPAPVPQSVSRISPPTASLAVRTAPGGRFVESQLNGLTSRFYWVPDQVRNTPADEVSPEVATIADSRRPPPAEVMDHLCSEYNGVLGIDNERQLRRVPTWACLMHGRGHIDCVHTDTLQTDIQDVRIPLSVGRDGRAVMFAYLAAHGFSNTMIADAFDVQSSTVRVNLPRYKTR